MVDYVYEHPFEEKAYTKEEIEKTYKKLIKDCMIYLKKDKNKNKAKRVKKTEGKKKSDCEKYIRNVKLQYLGPNK